MIAALLAVVFTMPPSWTPVAVANPPGSSVEMLEIARGPADQGFQSQINVLRHRVSNPPASIEEWAQQSEAYLEERPDVKVLASHAESLCNGTRDGWWIESTGTYNGRALDLVQTALLDDGFEYVATYSRAMGTPFVKDALDALDTLCPTAEAPGGTIAPQTEQSSPRLR